MAITRYTKRNYYPGRNEICPKNHYLYLLFMGLNSDHSRLSNAKGDYWLSDTRHYRYNSSHHLHRGEKPYGYMWLGDISVLIFFGWLSVFGTYYLHTNHFNLMILLPATACRLLSVTVPNVNNMRDIENDIKAGKNTLAVRLDTKGTRKYHAALILIAIFCLACYIFITGRVSYFSRYIDVTKPHKESYP